MIAVNRIQRKFNFPSCRINCCVIDSIRMLCGILGIPAVVDIVLFCIVWYFTILWPERLKTLIIRWQFNWFPLEIITIFYFSMAVITNHHPMIHPSISIQPASQMVFWMSFKALHLSETKGKWWIAEYRVSSGPADETFHEAISSLLHSSFRMWVISN